MLAILLALTAVPLFEGYTMLLKYLGLTNITTLEALSLTMQREPNQWLGIVSLFGILAWFFLLIYYSANFWGTDYFPLKGMLVMMTGEALMFSIFGTLGGNETLAQNISGNFVHATSSAVCGVWVGFLYQKTLFKNWPGASLKTDRPLLAILIGSVGLLILEGNSMLGKYLGLTTVTCMEATSMMWLKTPNEAVGALGLMGMGSLVCLLGYYSVNLWGTDYVPLKAGLIALTCEGLLFQIFGVLKGNYVMIQNTSGNLVHAWGAIVAGAVVGVMYQKILFKGDLVHGFKG